MLSLDPSCMRVTDNKLYFGNTFAGDLVAQYGSPLFVYDEGVLRERCRELRSLLPGDRFRVNFSCKANSNIALLKIIREEGLMVDAMSPGEIFLNMEAGYQGDEILFIPNNVSQAEMQYAIDRGVMISLDSLAQLESFGQLKPGGEVFVRINPGIGDGHSKKVITGGKAKFGVQPTDIAKIHEIARQYQLTIIGINMHIGSFFLEPDNYIAAIKQLLEIAGQFGELRYLDFGGGIGIPYRKGVQQRFNISTFGAVLKSTLDEWESRTGRTGITYLIEPGRYPVAECSTLLTTVHAVKENYGTTYVGTDLGFNVLIRPMLYEAYHEVIVCDNVESDQIQPVSICGNICESGDLICENRPLPPIAMGNTLAVFDAGAYGFAMSSNYNARLRPAEVLVQTDHTTRVIREREDLSYLLLNQKY